jgi:protein-tyrosine-phosphatase
VSDLIGVYCLRNAARSPLLEALLKKTYPDFTFFSGGIAAHVGDNLPKNSKRLAKLLGLPETKNKSENLMNQSELLTEASLIIAADDLVSEVITKVYADKSVISVEKKARDLEIRVVDPVNLSGEEFEYQVGKFLYCGYSLFSEVHAKPTIFGIFALVANQKNIESEVRFLYHGQYASGIKPLVIDCDFKFASKNGYLGFITDEEQILIDPNDLLNLDYEELIGVSAIRPLHELSAWESLMTSTQWRDWLQGMANRRPVVLMCTPVDIKEGQRHNSFLEALFAEKMVYRARSI